MAKFRKKISADFGQKLINCVRRYAKDIQTYVVIACPSVYKIAHLIVHTDPCMIEY